MTTIQTKSPVSAWLALFLANRPEALAMDAWRHLVNYAIPNGVPGIEGFDPQRKEVLFRTAPERPLRRIGRASFMHLVYVTRKRIAERPGKKKATANLGETLA